MNDHHDGNLFLLAGPEAILDAIGDVISIQDKELRIVYQNKAHVSLMGAHAGEYCYTAYQERGEPCQGCHLLLSFTDGEAHRREVTAEIPGRGKIHVEIVSAPLRDADGEIVGGIESVRDVTERVLMEERLLDSEQRLKLLNLDLERRARELTAVNQELESFSYTVSHDLRKPLTVINGYCGLIQDLCGRDLKTHCRQYLNEISNGTDNMNRLIDVLLEFARLALAEVHRESVDLGTIASGVATDLALTDPGRRVTFRIARPVPADADAKLVRVVLENLLGNAWKYTGKRDEATIEFGLTDVDGMTTYFVRDNGIGFDMTHADQLFIPFRRLTGTDVTGHGIGLATVERIIKRHGGKVWAEGVPGMGATFFFTL